MSKGTTSYKIGDQNGLYYLTFSTVEWIDIFTRKRYKDIVVDSLQYCQKEKGLELFSWVLMSNHIHLVAKAKEHYKLSDILRDFKKHTSKQIIKSIQEEPESRRVWLLAEMLKAGQANSKNSKHQLWRNDNHPIELYTNEVISQKVDYIHNNPVLEGIVASAEDYLYSSAKNYCDEEGLLEVERI
jgi:REP element-mobilizing transposase RayT